MRLALGLLLAAALYGQGRLAPPAAPGCSRDHLTSFTGVVSSYSRTPTQLRLTVKTDDDTVEKFVLKYRPGEDAARWFLFGRERFEPRHWREIERAPGRLKAGARATVWVCDDGAQPVVDWEPPRR